MSIYYLDDDISIGMSSRPCGKAENSRHRHRRCVLGYVVITHLCKERTLLGSSLVVETVEQSICGIHGWFSHSSVVSRNWPQAGVNSVANAPETGTREMKPNPC